MWSFAYLAGIDPLKYYLVFLPTYMEDEWIISKFEILYFFKKNLDVLKYGVHENLKLLFYKFNQI